MQHGAKALYRCKHHRLVVGPLQHCCQDCMHQHAACSNSLLSRSTATHDCRHFQTSTDEVNCCHLLVLLQLLLTKYRRGLLCCSKAKMHTVSHRAKFGCEHDAMACPALTVSRGHTLLLSLAKAQGTACQTSWGLSVDPHAQKRMPQLLLPLLSTGLYCAEKALI